MNRFSNNNSHFKNHHDDPNNVFRKHKFKISIAFAAIFAFSGVIIFIALVAPIYYGIGALGPKRTFVATVKSKHIDYKSNSDGNIYSHYMVTTDQGTFEVDNSPLLGVANADEIFGYLKEDHIYMISTKGNRVVGNFFQCYPFIISTEEVVE